jgi:hypothetical protein
MPVHEMHAASERPARPRTGVLFEGSLVGITGAIVVALWFLVQDLAVGQPLRTPALLGAALFDGVRDPAVVSVTPRLVVGYTLVHLALYIAFGLAAAGLFALAELQPRVLFPMFMLVCCLTVGFLAMVTFIAQWLSDAHAPWAVLAGNVLGAAAMGAVLVPRHRRVLRFAPTSGE